MEPTPENTPQAEHRYHNYVGSRIPWYVRIYWLLFWAFAMYYSVKYLFPELQYELKALL